MSTLETTLAQHRGLANGGCACGWGQPTLLPSYPQHAAHVADQVRAHLQSREVVAAAVEGLRDSRNDVGCDEPNCISSDHHLARAALAAALNTNQPTNGGPK